MCMYEQSDRKFAATLRRAAPEMHNAFVALNEAVFRDPTASLPAKTRELIAIGVAVTTQCPFCIETHTKAATDLGATQEEIAEATMVSAALRAGGAVTHGFLAMKVRESHLSASTARADQ